jgi:hypothetical protein
VTDPAPDNPPSKRLLKVVLVVVVIVAIFLVAKPLGYRQPAPPEPQSTEWANEPEGPAVPVTLPKTPMTNVPEKPPE